MSIRFFLKGFPRHDGRVRVLETYELPIFEGGKPGLLCGTVDDSVRKGSPEAYKAFADYVRANEDALYTRVRAGEVIECPESKPAEPPALEVKPILPEEKGEVGVL